MSLRSWEAEFYPVSATDAAEWFEHGDWSAYDLVEHSLRKWRGLRQENLDKHGIGRLSAYTIGDPDTLHPATAFQVSASTCALCEAYDPTEELDDTSEDYVTVCNECPLYLSRGNVSCDTRTEHEKLSPFYAYGSGNGPEAMIAALKKALEECA